MEFRRYVALLWWRWPLILLCALLGLGGATTYGLRAPRLYRATASLSVTPSVIEYWTGQAVERLLNNYALRLRSGPFTAQVAEDLQHIQPPPSSGEIMSSVRAVASGADFRITIQVDHHDPSRAQAIANAVTQRFIRDRTLENLGRQRRDIDLTLMEAAGLPTTPFSPRPRRAATAGLLLGVMVGLLAAVLLEYWDDTVRGADEVPGLLGVPVVGVIPPPKGRPAIWRRWVERRGRSELAPQIGVAGERR